MAKKTNKFIEMVAGADVEDEVREFAGKQNIDLDKLEKFHDRFIATDEKRKETQKMVSERVEAGDHGPAMMMAMNHQKITMLAEHGQRVQMERQQKLKSKQ